MQLEDEQTKPTSISISVSASTSTPVTLNNESTETNSNLSEIQKEMKPSNPFLKMVKNYLHNEPKPKKI